MGGFGLGLISQFTGSLASSFTSWIVKAQGPPNTPAESVGLPYRPSSWGVLPRLYLMSLVTPQGSTAAQGTGKPAQPTNYYFDAVFHSEHSEEWAYTQHPVQDGAALCDHVYHKPSRIVLEVGMSDLMDSFVSDQYSGGTSKSVNAYQKFKEIANLRIPITLSTRLEMYDNMIISNIRTNDNRETRWSLKCWITFAQIIPAKVSITTSNVLQQQIMNLPSARPQDTDLTNFGAKVTSAPSQALTSATQVTSPVSGASPFLTAADMQYIQGSSVPGAGDFSSYASQFAVSGGH